MHEDEAFVFIEIFSFKISVFSVLFIVVRELVELKDSTVPFEVSFSFCWSLIKSILAGVKVDDSVFEFEDLLFFEVSSEDVLFFGITNNFDIDFFDGIWMSLSFIPTIFKCLNLDCEIFSAESLLEWDWLLEMSMVTGWDL